MPRYYGVIGNRDYIKINGEKRPFWEFLDRQPYGYLTSLVYKRKDLPDMPMIFDCGAWSYRNEDTPKINAQIALDGYLETSKPGDILIAPDHMLIDNVDLDSRRMWNTAQAKDFLSICPKEFSPMATLHGMDIDERIEHGTRLADMGFRHIAIGGVAARAAQKKLVLSMVEGIRDTLPGVWLHVLGLSSPPYTAAWHRIGIESFDGSSHFKQAFTGGAFFTVGDGKLKKWQASRPSKGEIPTAPPCTCLACQKLKKEGIDTRTFGSNENNMGRAAHNMNMLMIAQDIAVNGNTVLVSCVGKKADTAMSAKDLYRSEWFRKARVWAEKNGDRWFILSALHGLVHPDRIIEPYEKTLNKMDNSERSEWADGVCASILKAVPGGRLTFLAGRKYREKIIAPMEMRGLLTATPMKGMGIGQQLAWLKTQNQEQMEIF